MNCKDCKFFRPDCLMNKSSGKKWGTCSNPKLDIDRGELIEAGGFDGYGDYLHMTENFGCIFAEAK